MFGSFHQPNVLCEASFVKYKPPFWGSGWTDGIELASCLSPEKRDTPAVRTVSVDGYFNTHPRHTHTHPYSADTPNEEKNIKCDRRCTVRCVLVRISECNVLQHDGCAIYICTGWQAGGSDYNSNSVLQVSAIPDLSFSGVIRNGSRDQFSPWGFERFFL